MPSYNSFSISKLKGLKSNFNSFKFQSIHKNDKRKLILIGSVFLFFLLTTVFLLISPSLSNPQKAQGQILNTKNSTITDIILNETNNSTSITKNYGYIDLNNFTGFTINQIANSTNSIVTSSSSNSTDLVKVKSENSIYKIKTRQILSLKIPIKTSMDMDNLYLELQVNKELQIVASTMQLIQDEKIQNIPASSINTQTGIISIIPNTQENGLGTLKKDSPLELLIDIYIPEKTAEGIYNVDLISNQIDLSSNKRVTNELYSANLIVSKEDLSTNQASSQASSQIAISVEKNLDIEPNTNSNTNSDN